MVDGLVATTVDTGGFAGTLEAGKTTFLICILFPSKNIFDVLTKYK